MSWTTGPVSTAQSSHARRSGRRVSNNQIAVKGECRPDAWQRRDPFLAGEEYLVHVAGHEGQVDLQGPQGGGVAMNPGHMVRALLVAGHGLRCCGRVNTCHVDAAAAEQDR